MLMVIKTVAGIMMMLETVIMVLVILRVMIALVILKWQVTVMMIAMVTMTETIIIGQCWAFIHEDIGDVNGVIFKMMGILMMTVGMVVIFTVTLVIMTMLMTVMTKFDHWIFIHSFKTTCMMNVFQKLILEDD